MSEHVFSAGFLFCGLGAGARGFIEASARLGKHEAHFKNLGGIDNDPLACEDFEKLTGGPSVCADLSKLKPRELRRAWGRQTPDAVFQSSPCKGFSGLLSKKSASQEKYQAMNRLVLQGFFLVCETWKKPPALLVLENVPRITTRGEKLLQQVRQLLAGYGYLFHEATHDCGEIGGLAQHRRRYLLVARLPAACNAYVYRPSKKRVRACGEVLGELPLPAQPEAGELHNLPKLSWLNWVRLARIPPGGDWRDLERPLPGTPEAEALKAWEQKGIKQPGGKNWFKGKHHVEPWTEPSRTVVGGPSNGAQNVADPRLARGGDNVPFNDQLRVNDWATPTDAVTTGHRKAVADPRLSLGATAENAGDFKGRPGLMGVGDWAQPAPTVTGRMMVSGGHGTAAIADPRLPEFAKREVRFSNQYKLRGWEEPAGTVTGDTDIQEGAQSVADPRLPRRNGSMGVKDWSEPADTVTGESYPSNGSASVADPRIPIGNSDKSRGGALGVLDWERPAKTVTGEMRPGGSNTPAAVADPRVNPDDLPLFRGSFGVVPWSEPAPCVRGASSVRTSKSAVADPRLPTGQGPGAHNNKMAVTDWADPAPTVIGASRPGGGAASVADPRLAMGRERPFGNINKVTAWDEPAGTVVASPAPSSGGGAVADPRGLELAAENPDRHWNKYAVEDWNQPARSVIGATRPGSGGPAVADPRLKCKPRSGVYGVLSWEEAATTVTGSAHVDNGAFAVADPRKPPDFIPVILSPWDGTWHRPLTTLELAVLQGLPPILDGKPLKLAGKGVAKWRERIGNAVPVQAGTAIAETLLVALLASALGTWTLGSTGIWVRNDGTTEDEANAPYEIDTREVA